MKAKELASKFKMVPQKENGLVFEEQNKKGLLDRANSGHAYYYFKPKTPTKFHVIDCDEYWIYHGGDDLEVYEISPKGKLKIHMLGCSKKAKLCLFIKKGNITATKPLKNNVDGTFVSLITVPQFSPKGLQISSTKEIMRLCPEAKIFFDC